MFVRPLVVVLALSVAPVSLGAAWAGEAKPAGGHDHHAMAKPARAGLVNSTKAYEAVMATMHRAMNAPRSGNADVDFARQMVPHHQAAVDMANIQLRHGRDERLKSFNRWVIRAQELEIGMMNNWLYRRDNQSVVSNANDYYGEAMRTMHHGMMIQYTGDADLDYVRGMIPHHQGAVDMARILLATGNDPELNRLANDIFDSQTYEIAWMQDWLAAQTAK